MGFRFFRRIAIFPGVTLNLSKRGVSLSLGVRGARVTLGKNGMRKTIGLPGTGMSYTSVSPWKSLRSLWRKKMKISISGGIVGGIIGAICAGPLGIVFGIGLGLYFINFSPPEDTKRLPHEEDDDDSVSQKGLQLFFQCLGKLAKSDGRVSEDEAAFVRSIMQAWKLDKEARRQMGAEFNKGRDSSTSFLHLVTQLSDELKRSHAPYSVRCTIVQAFCALAMADDELHPAERHMLDDAGRVLEAEESVHEFFSDNEEPDDEDKDAEPSSRDSLQHCYDILGISSTATDAEVKSAYRRKAKEFHPDLAEGAGLSANAIRRAKEKFQEIGDAYDTIRQHRGMK